MQGGEKAEAVTSMRLVKNGERKQGKQEPGKEEVKNDEKINLSRTVHYMNLCNEVVEEEETPVKNASVSSLLLIGCTSLHKLWAYLPVLF